MLLDERNIRPAIVTNGVKIVMTFIDRIGFPILVSIGLWYLNIKLTETITRLNNTLIKQTVILESLAKRWSVKIPIDTSAQEDDK